MAVPVKETCLYETKTNCTTLSQGYSSADTRSEDLHNCNHHSTASVHKQGQCTCIKLGPSWSSMGIWSLKDFSRLFLFITVVIPRNNTLQQVMHSSEVFLAENLTVIHGTNAVPSLSKAQLPSAEVSCNLKKDKQELSFLLNKPNCLG